MINNSTIKQEKTVVNRVNETRNEYYNQPTPVSTVARPTIPTPTISSCNKLNEPPDLTKQQPPQTVTKFFWTVIDKIKFPNLSIPYLLKNDDAKYLSVRIIERTLLSKYENNYSDEVKQFGSLNSELCTESDVVVLNEINDDHLNKEYGHEPFTIQDTLVQLEDFLKFYEILSRTCRTKDELRLNNNLTNVTRIQQQPPQQLSHQPQQQQQQPPSSSSIVSYLASNSIYQNQPHTSSLNIPDFVFNSNSSILNQSQNNHRQQQPPPQQQRTLTPIQPMTNSTNVFRNERENNNIYGQIPNNFQRNHHQQQQLPPLPPPTSSFLPNLDMIDNTIQLRNNIYQNRSNLSLNQDSQRLNSHHFNQNNQQSMINNNIYQQQQQHHHHHQIDLSRRNINSPTTSINSNEILSRLHQNHHMHHQPQPQPIQPQQQFYSNPNSNPNISARLNMEISSNFIQQPSLQRPQVQRPINVPVHISNQQPLQINNNNRNMVIQHESLPQPITSNNELFYNNNSLDNNLNSMRLARSSQTPILNSSSPLNNLLMSQQKQINKTTNSNIIDAIGNNNNQQQPVLNRQENLVNNNNNQFSQPIQYNRISNSLSCQHPTVNINNHHHHHQQQHHHLPILNSPTPPVTPTPNNLVYPNHSLASSSIILPSPPILPPPLPQQQFINKQSINNPIISYSDQLVTGASSSSVATVPVPVINNNLDRTSRNSIDSNSNASKLTYYKIKQQISDSSLNSSLNEQEITNDNDDDCIILDEESESEPIPKRRVSVNKHNNNNNNTDLSNLENYSSGLLQVNDLLVPYVRLVSRPYWLCSHYQPSNTYIPFKLFSNMCRNRTNKEFKTLFVIEKEKNLLEFNSLNVLLKQLGEHLAEKESICVVNILELMNNCQTAMFLKQHKLGKQLVGNYQDLLKMTGGVVLMNIKDKAKDLFIFPFVDFGNLILAPYKNFEKYIQYFDSTIIENSIESLNKQVFVPNETDSLVISQFLNLLLFYLTDNERKSKLNKSLKLINIKNWLIKYPNEFRILCHYTPSFPRDWIREIERCLNEFRASTNTTTASSSSTNTTTTINNNNNNNNNDNIKKLNENSTTASTITTTPAFVESSSSINSQKKTINLSKIVASMNSKSKESTNSSSEPVADESPPVTSTTIQAPSVLQSVANNLENISLSPSSLDSVTPSVSPFHSTATTTATTTTTTISEITLKNQQLITKTNGENLHQQKIRIINSGPAEPFEASSSSSLTNSNETDIQNNNKQVIETDIKPLQILHSQPMEIKESNDTINNNNKDKKMPDSITTINASSSEINDKIVINKAREINEDDFDKQKHTSSFDFFKLKRRFSDSVIFSKRFGSFYKRLDEETNLVSNTQDNNHDNKLDTKLEQIIINQNKNNHIHIKNEPSSPISNELTLNNNDNTTTTTITTTNSKRKITDIPNYFNEIGLEAISDSSESNHSDSNQANNNNNLNELNSRKKKRNKRNSARKSTTVKKIDTNWSNDQDLYTTEEFDQDYYINKFNIKECCVVLENVDYYKYFPKILEKDSLIVNNNSKKTTADPKNNTIRITSSVSLAEKSSQLNESNKNSLLQPLNFNQTNIKNIINTNPTINKENKQT